MIGTTKLFLLLAVCSLNFYLSSTSDPSTVCDHIVIQEILQYDGKPLIEEGRRIRKEDELDCEECCNDEGYDHPNYNGGVCTCEPDADDSSESQDSNHIEVPRNYDVGDLSDGTNIRDT